MQDVLLCTFMLQRFLIISQYCLFQVNYIIKGQNAGLVGMPDEWVNWDLRCYDNIFRAMKFYNIPTDNNKFIDNF